MAIWLFLFNPLSLLAPSEFKLPLLFLPQYEGVPQGSVISTTLSLITLSGIVSIYTLLPGIRSSLCVDDLAIYSSGSSLHTLIQ